MASKIVRCEMELLETTGPAPDPADAPSVERVMAAVRSVLGLGVNFLTTRMAEAGDVVVVALHLSLVDPDAPALAPLRGPSAPDMFWIDAETGEAHRVEPVKPSPADMEAKAALDNASGRGAHILSAGIRLKLADEKARLARYAEHLRSSTEYRPPPGDVAAGVNRLAASMLINRINARTSEADDALAAFEARPHKEACDCREFGALVDAVIALEAIQP